MKTTKNREYPQQRDFQNQANSESTPGNQQENAGHAFGNEDANDK